MKEKLTTSRLILAHPKLEDLEAYYSFVKRNSLHFAKWETKLPDNIDNAQDKAMRLKQLAMWIEEDKEKKSARYFLKPKDHPNLIIGMCNFTNIIRGCFQACYLGYKIDCDYEGKGLMFEALETLISHIFKNLELHRIMANYMPINAKSEKLLSKLGFVIEGYANRYLLINGQWEDHVLTALSSELWGAKSQMEHKSIRPQKVMADIR